MCLPVICWAISVHWVPEEAPPEEPGVPGENPGIKYRESNHWLWGARTAGPTHGSCVDKFTSLFPGMCISHLSRAAKITHCFLSLFTSFKYNRRPQLSRLSTSLFGLNGFTSLTNSNSPPSQCRTVTVKTWMKLLFPALVSPNKHEATLILKAEFT